MAPRGDREIRQPGKRALSRAPSRQTGASGSPFRTMDPCRRVPVAPESPEPAMPFPVTLSPSGRTFTAAPGETLLDAGLAAGIALPYQCRTGSCGTCRATVLAGEVSRLPDSAGLDAADACLLCRTEACGPVTLACDEVNGLPGLPLCRLPVRIVALEKPAPDVALLRLKLPMGQTLAYRAGQYVDVRLRDGTCRSYSLATAPGSGDELELHIRHRPGGSFTDQLFGRARVRDMLRIEGPFGRFHLDETSARPMILLASGTGFAPLKAIVEDMQARGIARPAALYWGGRRAADLYAGALAGEWARTRPEFSYVPVLSEPDAGWTGRTGLVHAAVMADFPDLSGHDVYACGAPVMVEAARADFTGRCGLPADRFFADAFL